MEFSTIVLLIAAVIPAVFFVLYIDMMDNQKPEPWHVLLLSVLVGAAASLTVTKSGLPFLPERVPIVESHSLSESLNIGFIGLAIPVEIAKWIALFIFLSLNKHYDEYLDGIVYSVSLSMGFAWLWSVWFMTSGIDASPFELMEKCIFIFFILIPIHLGAGSVMGFFFALARGRNKFRNYTLALLLPILISGLLYSLFFMLSNLWAYYIIAGILLPVISIISLFQVFRLLKMDGIKYKLR